jgi:hypothetical protein
MEVGATSEGVMVIGIGEVTLFGITQADKTTIITDTKAGL